MKSVSNKEKIGHLRDAPKNWAPVWKTPKLKLQFVLGASLRKEWFSLGVSSSPNVWFKKTETDTLEVFERDTRFYPLFVQG